MRSNMKPNAPVAAYDQHGEKLFPIDKRDVLTKAIVHRANEQAKVALQFASFDEKMGRVRQEIVMGILAADCDYPYAEVLQYSESAYSLLANVKLSGLSEEETEEFLRMVDLHAHLAEQLAIKAYADSALQSKFAIA